VKSADCWKDNDETDDEDGASKPLRVMDRRYDVCAEMRVSNVASGYDEVSITSISCFPADM